MYTQTQVLDEPSFNITDQENTRVKGHSDTRMSVLAPSLIVARQNVSILKSVDQDYAIFRGENCIGRSDICDIIINNPSISGKHAVIEVEDEESHVIYDCGSTNKTKLGQIKLKPNIRYNLNDGDIITFADCITTYIKVNENITQDKDDTGSDTSSELLFYDALVPETPFQMKQRNHEVSEVVVAETPEPESRTNVSEIVKSENDADEDIFAISAVTISNMETPKVNRNVTKKIISKENIEDAFIIGNESISEAETQLYEKLHFKPKVSSLGSKLFEDDDSFEDDVIPATQDEKKDAYEENSSFNNLTKNHDDDTKNLNYDILNRKSPERQVINSNIVSLNSKFKKVTQVPEEKELQNPIFDAETQLASLHKESDIILFSQDSIYIKEAQILGLKNENESFIQDKATSTVRNLVLKGKKSNGALFDMETQIPEFDKELLSADNVKNQVNYSTNMFATPSRQMVRHNVRSAIKEKQNKNMKNTESLKEDFSEANSDDISDYLTQINTSTNTLIQVNIDIGDLKSKANKKKKSNKVNTSMVNKSLNSTMSKKNVSENEPISEENDISDVYTQINPFINLNKNTDEVQLRIDENKSDMHVGRNNRKKSLKFNEVMSTSEDLAQINYNLLGKNVMDEEKMVQNFNEGKISLFDMATQVQSSHDVINDSSINNDEKLPETKSLPVVKQEFLKPNESGKKLPYSKNINSRREDMSTSEDLAQIIYNLLGKNIMDEKKMVQDFNEGEDSIFDMATQVQSFHNVINDSSIDNGEKLPETKNLPVVKQEFKPNESGKKLSYSKTINSRQEDMPISEDLAPKKYNLLGENVIEENKIVQDFDEHKDPIFDAMTQVPNSHNMFDCDSIDNDEKLLQAESSLVVKDVKSNMLHRKVLDINDVSNESESLLAIVSEDVDEIVRKENNKFGDTKDPRNETKHVSKCDLHKPLTEDNNSNEILKLETSVMELSMSNTDDTNFDFSECLLQRAVAASEATLSPGLKPVYSDEEDEDDEIINLPQRERRTNRTRRHTKKMLDFLNSPMDKTVVENINSKRQSNIVSEKTLSEARILERDPIVELTKISTQEIESYVIKNNPEVENIVQENNIKDKQKNKRKKLLDKDISEESSHEGIQEIDSNTSLIKVGSNTSGNNIQSSENNTFTKTDNVFDIDLSVNVPCTSKSKKTNVLKIHSVDEKKRSKKIVNIESANQKFKKESRVNNNKDHSYTNNAEKSVSDKSSVVEKVNICTRSLRNKNISKTGSDLKSCTLKGDHPEEFHVNKTICANRSVGAKVVEKLKVKEIKRHQTRQKINTEYSVDKSNHSTRSTKASNEGMAEKCNARAGNNKKAIDLIKGDVKRSILKKAKVKANEEPLSKKSKEAKVKANEEPFSKKSNCLNRSRKALEEDLSDKLNLCVRNPARTVDLVKEDIKESTRKVIKAKVYEAPFREKTYYSTRSTRNKVLSKTEIAKKDKSDTKYLPELEKEDEKVKPKTSTKAVKVIPVYTGNHMPGNKDKPTRKPVQNETKDVSEIKLSTVHARKINLTHIYEDQEKKQNPRKTKAEHDLSEVLPFKKSKRIATRNKRTMSIIEDFNTPNPDDTSSTFPNETKEKLTSLSCKEDVKIVDSKRNKRGRPKKLISLNNKLTKFEPSKQFDLDMMISQSNLSLIYDEDQVGHCSTSNYKSNITTSAMECSTSFESLAENLTGAAMKKVKKNSINRGRRKELGKFIDDSEITSHISSTRLNSLSKHEDCVTSDSEDPINRPSTSSFPSPTTRMLGRRREKVLFTGMSDPKLEAVVKELGSTIVDSPQTCSVLVTDKIRRTVKLLCCIGRGIPIVSPEWIEESKYVGILQDPWKHLIVDKEAENKYSFCLEKSLNLAKRALFLKNYSVYATPSVQPPPSDLKGIVESCGGEFLDNEFESWPRSNCLIISCREDRSLWEKMKNKNKTPLIVASEALLSGVLQQHLDVKSYKLS